MAQVTPITTVLRTEVENVSLHIPDAATEAIHTPLGRDWRPSPCERRLITNNQGSSWRWSLPIRKWLE